MEQIFGKCPPQCASTFVSREQSGGTFSDGGIEKNQAGKRTGNE